MFFFLFFCFLFLDAASGRTQQSSRKTSDSKKSIDDNDDASTASGSSAKSIAKPPEDDVYEFKNSSSGDDKSDNGKGSDKEEKSDDHPSKRSYSDVEGDEDDSKRKKRKEFGSDSSSKDSNKTARSGKSSGTTMKTATLTNKTVASLERKSPSGSPKPTTSKSADSDGEGDDKGSGDSFGLAGPKVPPLKIVIPQSDQETGNRNGKNTSARSHAALPYVVPSSSNSNDSADKESASSRCTSPSDSTKSVDDKKQSGTAMTNEEQRQQRVLRSSHRGGPSVDRGSNNSSPTVGQLQSNSPSEMTSSAPITSSVTTATTVSTSSTSSVTESDPSRLSATTAAPTVANTASGTSTSPSHVANVETEATSNAPSPSASSTSSSTKDTQPSAVELHPRKRKIRASKDENKQNTSVATNQPQSQPNPIAENAESVENNETPHPHDQPITNCYQMYIDIRSQISRKHRLLIPVQPKPPQGFKDYLLNRRSYVLAGKSSNEPTITFPTNVAAQLKDMFTAQEKERHKLKMQHMVEKEKLVLAVEQEILRVHGRAGRALANQSLPFSACTILKDNEVYNIITPEQEEKDRNARSRYNGRLFLSWLQDVDDKWEKIKVCTSPINLISIINYIEFLLQEAMVLRHHNEAESLHAVQRMDWECKMKELNLCEFKAHPVIEDSHVPMVNVSDDFDLLP